MTDEINETIRVLQLTTYDEEEWDADNLTVMKKALNAIDGKAQAAHDWLQVRQQDTHYSSKQLHLDCSLSMFCISIYEQDVCLHLSILSHIMSKHSSMAQIQCMYSYLCFCGHT